MTSFFNAINTLLKLPFLNKFINDFVGIRQNDGCEYGNWHDYTTGGIKLICGLRRCSHVDNFCRQSRYSKNVRVNLDK